MKYYGTTKEGKKDYILGVEGIENNEGERSFEVTFADNRKFENLEATAENLDKIKKKQEEQATEGIDKLDFFKKRRTLAGVASGLSTLISTGAFACATEAVCSKLTEVDEPLINIVGIGTIVLANIIVGGYHFNKNHQIVGELERVSFRNDHRKQLDKFRKYPNVTAGLSKKKAEFLTSAPTDEDPFDIINIENFTTADLRQIDENIQTEETFAFDYPDDKEEPKTYQKK